MRGFDFHLQATRYFCSIKPSILNSFIGFLPLALRLIAAAASAAGSFFVAILVANQRNNRRRNRTNMMTGCQAATFLFCILLFCIFKHIVLSIRYQTPKDGFHGRILHLKDPSFLGTSHAGLNHSLGLWIGKAVTCGGKNGSN